jgi:hypothetical protein
MNADGPSVTMASKRQLHPYYSVHGSQITKKNIPSYIFPKINHEIGSK